MIVKFADGSQVTYNYNSDWKSLAEYHKKSRGGSYTATPAYKTGGLADFTGPAWLDGTRSKPEMVLDAENTKTFIKFTDILSTLTKGKQPNTQSYGHNTFKIYINVDEIGSDYDVDMLVDRVKNDIYQEATHRNVNLITRTR